jgi:hypothetical protein
MKEEVISELKKLIDRLLAKELYSEAARIGDSLALIAQAYNDLEEHNGSQS